MPGLQLFARAGLLLNNQFVSGRNLSAAQRGTLFYSFPVALPHSLSFSVSFQNFCRLMMDVLLLFTVYHYDYSIVIQIATNN